MVTGSRVRTIITLASILYLGLVSPITLPVYAAMTPTNQADCEKAGMRWKPKADECKRIGRPLSSGRKVLAVIGLISASAALMLLLEEPIRSRIGGPNIAPPGDGLVADGVEAAVDPKDKECRGSRAPMHKNRSA